MPRSNASSTKVTNEPVHSSKAIAQTSRCSPKNFSNTKLLMAHKSRKSSVTAASPHQRKNRTSSHPPAPRQPRHWVPKSSNPLLPNCPALAPLPRQQPELAERFMKFRLVLEHDQQTNRWSAVFP